ncbi:MAG: serine hydrolase [Verrucomicrobiales bacterium]|nr:serine hydrolase [Verrucomicrobiales bacterium]
MGTISRTRFRRWRTEISRVRRVWAWIFLVVVAPVHGADRELSFPGGNWETVTPESRGFSSPKLEVLRRWLQTQQTTAIHVSVQGRVVFEYGDVKRVSKVASVRKSILAMLYGNYIRTNPAALDRTVVDLGLEEDTPFLPIETSATLYHLLTARSGVYLPTANRELTELMPRRGSQAPGTYFQYQNWDFNAAGTAFEKISRKEIFQALEDDLAKPLGMQDFDRALQRKNDERPITRHPEYAMYLSTRDMARIGLLMLAGGRWNGTALMPDGWSYRITRLVTPQNELHPLGVGAHATQVGRWGYGMLWWVWDAPNVPGTQTGPYQGAYSAMGANGQFITVIPSMNLVVAHKVDFDTDGNRRVSSDEYQTLLQLLINSSL